MKREGVRRFGIWRGWGVGRGRSKASEGRRHGVLTNVLFLELSSQMSLDESGLTVSYVNTTWEE